MGKTIPLVLLAVVLVAIAVWYLAYSLREQGQRRQRAADRRRTAYYRRWLRSRATDTERQAALTALDDAYAVGQLDLAEHDRRVTAVLAAATNADVLAQTGDLGAAPPGKGPTL
jgi:hypothetical protein